MPPVTDGLPRPAPGQPVTASVTCGGLTFVGASESAHTTFVFCRQLDLIFDIGSVVDAMLPIDTVLISHTHQDHLLGLTRYICLRRLQGMKPPRVLLPEASVKPVRRLLAVWQELEGGADRIPPDVALEPVEAGQEVRLSGNLVARAFPVAHVLPSLGYTVITRIHKLRREFYGRSGQELARLREEGVAITDPHDTPLVTFIGDTLPETLERTPDIGTSPVVILECTFLTPEHADLATPRGHLHIRDIIERIELFGNAEIILTHFSRRYRSDRVRELVQQALPPELAHRFYVLA